MNSFHVFTFIITLPSFAYIVLVSPEDGPLTG